MGPVNVWISELLIFVFCIIAAPISDTERRVDLIDEQGMAKTFLVSPVGNEYKVYETQGDNLYDLGVIKPVVGEDQIFIAKDSNGKNVLLDIPSLVNELDVKSLRNSEKSSLVFHDNTTIEFERSENILYVTPRAKKMIYVVQPN